jgi:hypothetical protein
VVDDFLTKHRIEHGFNAPLQDPLCNRQTT